MAKACRATTPAGRISATWRPTSVIPSSAGLRPTGPRAYRASSGAVRLQHPTEIDARDVLRAADRDGLAFELLERLDRRFGEQLIGRRLHENANDREWRSLLDGSNHVDECAFHGHVERTGSSLKNDGRTRWCKNLVDRDILGGKAPPRQRIRRSGDSDHNLFG